MVIVMVRPVRTLACLALSLSIRAPETAWAAADCGCAALPIGAAALAVAAALAASAAALFARTAGPEPLLAKMAPPTERRLESDWWPKALARV